MLTEIELLTKPISNPLCYLGFIWDLCARELNNGLGRAVELFVQRSRLTLEMMVLYHVKVWRSAHF